MAKSRGEEGGGGLEVLERREKERLKTMIGFGL